MTRAISTYYPGNSFPSVSLTGSVCSKQCDHCDGRYLKGMIDVRGKGKLYDFGMDLHSKGGIGFLLSGGCDIHGSVPLNEDVFLDIERLKSETDLKINLHTGLVAKETASRIANAGVDVVSFDLLGADETIQKVLHMNKKVTDFENSYRTLVDTGIEVVPHILAGFHYGKILGEWNAIDIASKFTPERAVLIILIPTPGTRMENVEGLNDEEILEVGGYMRDLLTGELILGCMRPKGHPDLEFSLLQAGFNGIVLPSKSTVRNCIDEGWEISRDDQCCAL